MHNTLVIKFLLSFSLDDDSLFHDLITSLIRLFLFEKLSFTDNPQNRPSLSLPLHKLHSTPVRFCQYTLLSVLKLVKIIKKL